MGSHAQVPELAALRKEVVELMTVFYAFTAVPSTLPGSPWTKHLNSGVRITPPETELL